MKLNKLPRVRNKSKKRVGRGYGSGKGGHTSGRGQKGQKSRGKVGLMFEGTKMRKSLIRRMPMSRGKGKFRSFKEKPLIINIKHLNIFKTGSDITIETLLKNKLVSQEALKLGVKILGDGKLTKKLNVHLPVSKKAKKKIEKVGGKVVEKQVDKKIIKSKVKKKSSVSSDKISKLSVAKKTSKSKKIKVNKKKTSDKKKVLRKTTNKKQATLKR